MALSALVARTRGYRTVGNTVYLYPEADIQRALASTSVPFSDDGVNITVANLTDLTTLYSNIFAQTIISQPVGNTGFSCGVGTLLEDLGKDRQFLFSDGQVVIKWRLVRQLSPQTNPPVAIPGDSPVNTIGYVTTFCALGPPPLGQVFDPAYVVRMG
jgi:hypothetical protein